MAVTHDAVDPTDRIDPANPVPADAALPLSPASETTATTMASSSQPSPLPSVTLAEQTFTPLSMDATDFDPPAKADTDARDNTSPAAREGHRLLNTSRSMEHLGRQGNLSRSSSRNSAAPAGAAGTTIVSAMVESFEALQAKSSSASLGYELLRTKSAGTRPADLASPPTTLSPSPSLSPSLPRTGNEEKAPRPADAPLTAAASLGAADPNQARPNAAQDENTAAAPQTAAATPNPDPPAPACHDPQAHDNSEPSPSAPSASESSPRAVVANTTLIRPTPSQNPSQRRSRAVSNPVRASGVRTSSSASLPLSHPTPDPNRLSQAGNFLGNIAALEATAERLSMTSSIEEAIREEHNELKRSESRRSSILRARATSAASESGSVYGQSQLSVASRQNSILGINNAARSGGYSPGGFVMSPQNSASAASGRLRSGSKASSAGVPSHIPEDADTPAAAAAEEHAQEYRFLPRHGPGKASTRSVASKLSLAQIAELEPPAALTKEALDEADRAAAAGETPDIDDDIRASAHQFIEAEFADGEAAAQAALGYGPTGETTPRLQLHQADEYPPYGAHRGEHERPMTSASGTTSELAQAAFGDFDGVHCDPEAGAFAPHPPPPSETREPPRRPRDTLVPRPMTYIDPGTGQQMLYYPAPVPAMLNLPPKLSRKPKDVARNTRRSQVVSAMPRASRESRAWLPDPTEGLRRSSDDAPFMGELLGGADASQPQPPSQAAGMEGGRPDYLSHARHPSEASTIQPPEQREMRRPQRLGDADKRKSRPIAADGMPPQLRASAFFDLPPEAPKIEVQDGSAMNVLDSLLDASAAAPVNAFTDHVFAGKLGAEVYGPEKKKKKAAAAAAAAAPPEEKAKRKTLVKRNSSGNLLEPGAEDKPKRKTLVKRNSSGNLLEPEPEKKRTSRFSLFGPKHEEESDSDKDDRPKSARRSVDGDARSRASASPNQLAPGPDEESEESDDEEPVYQGPPTTLLAELQLRKQQNKQRTRPLHHAHPDGMRSTLLELDAVAEVERKARHGKRVTLAWEDPAAVPRQEEEEDEDVPLGMLYVAKASGPGNRASTMDISAIMSEVNRPLGLMERREIEENEPLSRRRDRLLGRAGEPMPTSLTALQNRMSHMPGTPGGLGMGLRSQSRLTLPLHPAGGSFAGSVLGSRPGSRADDARGDESDSEVESETLAARKARLAAENPLPPPRPVSGTFSSELLKEFGPDEQDDDKSKTHPAAHSRTTSRDTLGTAAKPQPAAADDDDTPVAEEEETLGQRRRRLQREREAREREMAFSSLTRAATPNPGIPTHHHHHRPSTSGTAPAPMPMSLSTLLGAHPTGNRLMSGLSMGSMAMDPREQERMRREAEAARQQREMDAKMAALRAQMPTSLAAPAVGPPTGGYMGGRFNDGGGGLLGAGMGVPSAGLLAQQQQQQRVQGHLQLQQQQPQQQQRTSTLLSGGQMGVGMGMGMGMGMGGYGGSTPNLGVYNAAGGSGGGYYAGNAALGGPAGQQGHLDMVERWRQGVMP